VVVVWTGYDVSYTENSVIYAQRLNADGQRLWPDERIYINPSYQSQGHAGIVGDGNGGVIIGSRVGESSSVSRPDSVYAQLIRPEGSGVGGGGGREIQKGGSAPTVIFIAVGVVLAAILVVIGVFRRNIIARIFAAILPVLLGIAGLFSVSLVFGPFGYSHSWSYIPDTFVNKAAAFIVPLTGLAIGIIGIWKRTAPKWVTIPIVIFGALVAIITGLLFILQI
jgi:hypothetical protein